jgi:hypothetical protein
MALQWDFTNIFARGHTLYLGLTPEEIEATGIDFEKSCGNPDSGWFKVELSGTVPHSHFSAKGWFVVHQKPYVEQMLWALMVLMPAPGWGITEKNIDEVIRRTLIWQELVGPLDQVFSLTPNENKLHWSPRYIIEADIRALIGLEINIGSVSLPEFRKKIDKCLEEKSKSRQYNFLREQEEKDKKANADHTRKSA